MGSNNIFTSPSGFYQYNMLKYITVNGLNSMLGRTDIRSFTIKPTGEGTTSNCYRLAIKYRDAEEGYSRPRTLIYKTAATNSASRSCGLGYGLYQQETQFYRCLGNLLESLVPTCYDARFDAASKHFHILMADASPAVVGDDLVGATFSQARLAMETIGRIHGLSLRNPQWRDGCEWLECSSANVDEKLMSSFFQTFTSIYGCQISQSDWNICKLLVDNYNEWINKHAESWITGLVHGDFRLDNILYDERGFEAAPITIVDWQHVRWAPILGDVAYFLGGSLEDANQRTWLRQLLYSYVDAVDNGDVDMERCWHDLRIAAFYGIMINITSSVLVQRTERRDKLIPTLIRRHCNFVRLMGSEDIFDASQEL